MEMPAGNLTSSPAIAPAPGAAVRGKDLAFSGAVHGLRAFLTYWAVECLFLSVLPWLQTPAYEYLQLHPWFVVLALGVYAITGAVLGGLLALLIHRFWTKEPSAPQMVGPLALAVIFIPHAAAMGLQSQLPMSIVLAAITMLSMREGFWVEDLKPIINAWTASFAFLTYPFFIAEYRYTHTLRARQLLGVEVTLAVFLIPYAAYRWVPRLRRGLSGWRLAVFWAAITAALLGFSFGVKQQPLLNNLPASAAGHIGGHPNLILITMDTVRADHLSAYGYNRDTSPNLQQLAREAALFTNAIAAGDMTLSSHASIFTGMYASQHGAHPVLGGGGNRVAVGEEFGLRLPDHSQTLARILWERGYRTMAVAANTTFLQHAFHLDQGFQYYSQPNPMLFLARTDPFYLRSDLSRVFAGYFPLSMSQRAYRAAANVNGEALALLQQAKADKLPFFLFLNYMDAHQPYFPIPPYDVKYPGRDSSLTYNQYFAIEFGALSGKRPYTDADRGRDESQYDGGIAYIDAYLGDLFKQLRRLDLYDDTMLIVTSDHGQSFGEKMLVGHGTSVYQEQVHVPLIIKYPGHREAKVVDDLASHVDILPTVLGTLGYPVPKSLPGRNLSEAPRVPVTVISESFPCDLFTHLSPRFRRTERALFRESFKLITSTNGEPDLFDLSKDPREEHNLDSQDPQVASGLNVDLQHWLSTLPVVQTRPAVLDKRTVEGFRSLGYLQ
jgi:arylsulfatase A-like enzyme